MTDALGNHSFDLGGALTGYFWVCSCGQSSEPEFPEQELAQRDAERHVNQSIGIDSTSAPALVGDLYPLMDHLYRAQHLVDPDDLVEFGDFGEVMRLLDGMDRRGWLSASAVNHGDDRLMSARGIGLTPIGRAAIERAMTNSIDVPDERTTNQPDGLAHFADIGAKKVGRARFMNAVYEATGGRRGQLVSANDLGGRFGWSRSLTAEIVRYLVDEDLLEWLGMGAVGISHRGIVEVEEFHDKPDRATHHFPPMNVVIVTGSNYGQIQAGVMNSTQTQTTNDVEAIARFISEFRQVLGEVDPSVRPIIAMNLDDLDETVRDEGPNSPRARRVLATLQDFAVNLAASGTFLGLTEAVQHLPHF